MWQAYSDFVSWLIAWMDGHPWSWLAFAAFWAFWLTVTNWERLRFRMAWNRLGDKVLRVVRRGGG